MTHYLKIGKLNKKSLKNILILILILILIAIWVFFFLKYNKLERNKDYALSLDTSPSQIVKLHRLSACEEGYGESIKDREAYFATSSATFDGYKALLNCSYAVNKYYPEEKN